MVGYIQENGRQDNFSVLAFSLVHQNRTSVNAQEQVAYQTNMEKGTLIGRQTLDHWCVAPCSEERELQNIPVKHYLKGHHFLMTTATSSSWSYPGDFEQICK